MVENVMNTQFQFPNQRVSLKKKQSIDWTKKMAEYVINLCIASNDKSKTHELLDMANGKVNRKMYDYVLKAFGETSADKKSELLIEELREIDILQPIKDKYLGEFTSSYNNYQVYSHDPETVTSRNAAFGKKLMQHMNQILINELNKRGVNTGEESQEVEDVSKMLEEHIATWDAERIDKAQKRLNLLNEEIDAKLKYNQLYYYWWACEEAFTFRKIVKNSVRFEVVPPYEYYRVNSGNTFVEDDDYGMRMTYKSVYEIIDTLSDHLTESDIKYIKTITNETHKVVDRIELLKSRLIEGGMSSEEVGKCASQFDSIRIASNFTNIDKVPFIHYIFKTEVKVGHLKYVNEFGEIEESIVDEDYELDYDGGDISITYEWIHQIYEGEVIGYNIGNTSNLEAIYTKVRPVDIQREHFTNLNSCKSPYNGITFIVKDSDRKPIPYRINAYTALIRIYHYQMERAIYKWKSILAIPQSFLSDDSEMSTSERMSKMQGESLLVFNDTEVNPSLMQALKEVSTSATYNFVTTLGNLINQLKAEAYEVANMTPSRMGTQAAYQGKSVTENSLLQSVISSNWYLEMFNIFRGKDYLANYDFSKIAWIEGKQGSYVNEGTGEITFVDVDIDEHFSTNIGISVGNSKILDEKLRAMKEVGFAAAQNGDMELSTEVIMEDNLQALRGKIHKSIKAKQEYDANMQNLQNQALEKVKQMEIEAKDREQQVKLQIESMKAESAENVALINQETQLLVWEKRLQVDIDGNGYVSEDETGNRNLLHNMQKDREMLHIKRQELRLKEKAINNKNIQK